MTLIPDAATMRGMVMGRRTAATTEITAAAVMGKTPAAITAAAAMGKIPAAIKNNGFLKKVLLPPDRNC